MVNTHQYEEQDWNNKSWINKLQIISLKHTENVINWQIATEIVALIEPHSIWHAPGMDS